MNVDDEQEICGVNSSLELLCVLHMMAMLTLMEANENLIPKQSSLSERLVSAGSLCLYLHIPKHVQKPYLVIISMDLCDQIA